MMRPIVSLLIGCMVVVSARDTTPTADDYLVRDLDQIEPAFGTFEGDMYAGLLPTRPFGEKALGELMFWMFVPDHPTYDDSVVTWMNGGPGCSSLGGCLFEHCPISMGWYPSGIEYIDPNDPLVPNPYAWTNASIMLYIEQPHGTGFSKGVFPKNETEVGRDVYYMLQNLYTVFPDLRAKRLFMTGTYVLVVIFGLLLPTFSHHSHMQYLGESYAGMYVPSIAHYVYEQNKQQKSRKTEINLKGIALGNGWVDVRVQGPAVIDYAWWHGMIDSYSAKAFHQEWENCKDGSEQPPPFHAFTVPDECNIMGAVLEAAGSGIFDWGRPNAYDVTTWDTYDILDNVDGTMARFFNNPAVQDALNIKPRRHWVECMAGAGRRRLDESDDLPGKILLAQDQPISVVPWMAELLDAGIHVLVYNGDRDMTTNIQGSEMLLDTMEWSGAEGWSNGSFTRGLWLVDNDQVRGKRQIGGYIKTYKNLDFVAVYNSGHLVPM